MLCIHPKKKLMYVGIPKTGCISTYANLVGVGFHHVNKYKTNHKEIYHVQPPYNTEYGLFDYFDFPKEDYTIFSVIRDPLQRLISGFRYMIDVGATTHTSLHDYIMSSDLSNSGNYEDHMNCYWHTHVTQTKHLGECIDVVQLIDFKKLENGISKLLVNHGCPATQVFDHRNKSKCEINTNLQHDSQEWFHTYFKKDIELYNSIT
jgi:hypothetical protein